MKKTLLLLAAYLFISQIQLIAQNGGEKLLSARARLQIDPYNGKITQGDSTTFGYHNSSQEAKRIWYADATHNWTLGEQYIDYTYDTNDNLLYFLLQQGNDVVGWENEVRGNTTYDNQNHKIFQQVDTWSGSDWIFNNSTHWQYDANGRLQYKISDYGRVVYTYNAQGLLTNEISQSLQNGVYVNSNRYAYAYAPNDTNPSTISQYFWGGNLWSIYARNQYTYDLNGDYVQILNQVWGNGDWVNRSQTKWVYDTNRNNISWSYEEWDNGMWAPALEATNEYDSESHLLSERMSQWYGSWRLVELTRYYYTSSVSTQSPAPVEYLLYPNPADRTITMKSNGLNQVLIFDEQGRLLQSKSLQGNTLETISTGDLPAGNYFLQAVGKDGRNSVKPLQIRH